MPRRLSASARIGKCLLPLSPWLGRLSTRYALHGRRHFAAASHKKTVVHDIWLVLHRIRTRIVSRCFAVFCYILFFLKPVCRRFSPISTRSVVFQPFFCFTTDSRSVLSDLQLVDDRLCQILPSSMKVVFGSEAYIPLS